MRLTDFSSSVLMNSVNFHSKVTFTVFILNLCDQICAILFRQSLASHEKVFNREFNYLNLHEEPSNIERLSLHRVPFICTARSPKNLYHTSFFFCRYLHQKQQPPPAATSSTWKSHRTIWARTRALHLTLTDHFRFLCTRRAKTVRDLACVPAHSRLNSAARLHLR